MCGKPVTNCCKFVYNALAVPVAVGVIYPVFGILLTPIFKAAAMALNSVSVIGSALCMGAGAIGFERGRQRARAWRRATQPGSRQMETGPAKRSADSSEEPLSPPWGRGGGVWTCR